MKRIIFLLLFLIPSVFAQVNDYNDYSSLELDVELTSQFELQQLDDDARVEFVTANLSFFPQQTIGMELINFDERSTPPATVTQTDNFLSYRWDDPSSQQFSFGYNAHVKTESTIIPVDEKVSFPIDPIENQYTKGTEFIDITPEIRQHAVEIAAGEDDLYVVSFKVADWVEKNVKYDLNTLTADAVKPSSWVLANREGVCDELTNLFISMMRSLGVPARFVSGLAYTNVGYRWGPHGWAEVYFPDKGWVPFDVTYGQFGWVDPSHIKLKTATDSGDPSVKFLWRAYGIKFNSEKINLNAELTDTGEKLARQADFRVTPLVNNVGPGSYVPVEVVISNKNNYYLPESLTVTKAPELTEKNVKRVLLNPEDTEKVYWIAVVPDEADLGFSYMTFLEVEDAFHKKARANITYSITGEKYSLEEAQELIDSKTVQEKKIFTKNLEMKCTATDYIFSYEQLSVNCEVRNRGNSEIKDLQVCLRSDCKYFDLSIAERREAKFLVSDLRLGLNSLEIVAENQDVKVVQSVLVNVLENPDLVVTGFDLPEVIQYGANFNLSFILSVKAPVHSVKISVNDRGVTEIPDLVSSKRVIVGTSAREYVIDKAANVTVSFKDKNDKEYVVSNSVPVNVDRVPWFIKFLSFLRII